MLDKFVQELGKELSMSDEFIQLEPGRYKMAFAGDIEIEATQTPQNDFRLKGIIGKCPETNPDAFLAHVMEGNLFGKGTRGGSIGLNEEGNLLTLCLELDYNANYQDWRTRVEDFASVMSFWRNEALKIR